MAYCENCGKPISDDEFYCEDCKPKDEENNKKTKASKEDNSEDKEYKFYDPSLPFFERFHINLWMVIVAVLVIAVIVLAILLANANNKNNGKPDTPASPTVIIDETRVNELTGEVAALTKQLDEERAQNAEIIDKLSSVNAELAAVQKEYELYKDSVDTSADKNEEYIGRIAVLNEELDTLTKELAVNKADVKRLSDELYRVNTLISNVQPLEDSLKLMRNPVAFANLEALNSYLYYDDTDRVYRRDTDLNRGYILYKRIMRDGYMASFQVENIMDSIGLTGATYVFVEGEGIYKINATDDSIRLVRPGMSIDQFYQEPDEFPYPDN
jgi:DNA repair exonuclease SbcCD ATPase subunit